MRPHVPGGAVLGRRRLRKPGMERTAHGSAAWMDRLTPGKFPGWPALQGQPQYPHEPPRITAEEAHEADPRIVALGNAVVWQQAFPIARALKQWLDAGGALPAVQPEGMEDVFDVRHVAADA